MLEERANTFDAHRQTAAQTLKQWAKIGIIQQGSWCSGITPAQHAGGPGLNPQTVHFCSRNVGAPPQHLAKNTRDMREKEFANANRHLWDSNPRGETPSA